MKIRIDRSLCTGHGRCYSLAPEIYEPDEEGYNARRGQSLDVPPGLEHAARRGAESCPERAIAIEDGPGSGVESSPAPPIEELIAAPSMIVDPYPVYRRLHAEAPVWTTPVGEKVFSRHVDCTSILRDHETFGQAMSSHKKASFVMLDPPEHTRLRGLVAKAFTPRAIAKLEGQVRAASAEILAPIIPRGEMEVVHEYAKPLPARMITDMLGIPLADKERWEVWANAIHRGTAAIRLLPEQKARADELMAAAQEASAAEAAYFSEILARRRQAPPQDDVLATLMAAEEAGDRLTEEELLYTLVLLLGAGHHTSVNLITGGLIALLQHPEQMELLRKDRSLMPNAVDEMVRWDGVLQQTHRRVKRPASIGGVHLESGETVRCLLGAANRDPHVFEDPDVFDITRSNANRHLGFGFGVHHCLGRSLARSEVGVAFDALLDLPRLRLVSQPPYDYDGMFALRGVAGLSVAWS